MEPPPQAKVDEIAPRAGQSILLLNVVYVNLETPPKNGLLPAAH